MYVTVGTHRREIVRDAVKIVLGDRSAPVPSFLAKYAVTLSLWTIQGQPPDVSVLDDPALLRSSSEMIESRSVSE
jgi:hypothetical protein